MSRVERLSPPQVKTILDEFLEKLTEEFNMLELFSKAEEKTPYVLVALQECERMNTLTREMKRSLKEVDLGLKVHACGLGLDWAQIGCWQRTSSGLLVDILLCVDPYEDMYIIVEVKVKFKTQ